MAVTLPWPSPALSPNARVHRMAKAKAASKYRAACGWAAKAAGLGKVEAEALHLTLEFCPPDNRRRDLDNMHASFKAGADALADVLGVDDHRFAITLRRAASTPGGAVHVTIEKDATP